MQMQNKPSEEKINQWSEFINQYLYDYDFINFMNYGKYKFEQAKKEKEARKKQKAFELKEIRITTNIDTHDFEFKLKNAQKFLEDGNKVKITVKFRGREMNYLKLGENVLNDFITALEDIATVERKPLLEGKNMFIILAKKS